MSAMGTVFNGLHKVAVTGLLAGTAFSAYAVGGMGTDIMTRKWERDRIAAEAEAAQTESGTATTATVPAPNAQGQN